MTIEHMAENPTGETNPTTGEPNVVVAPAAKSGSRLDRLLGREPKPEVEVLVRPGEQSPQYHITTEGGYINVTDPETGEVVKRLPEISGGAGLVLPEGLKGPENETNPEKGRWLVEQIVDMRTKMSYAERYNAENGPHLKQLYEELQDFVNKIAIERNEKDPWDRYVRNEQGIVTGVKEIEDSPLLLIYDEQEKPLRLERPPQTSVEQPARSVTDEQRARLRDNPLQTLLADYANRATLATRRQEIQEYLSIYFGLAKEKGLLDGVDQVLKSIHRDIKGMSSDQARRLIAQRIGEAQEAAELTFEDKSTDQEVVDLYGVWTVYTRWARQRFELMLRDQNQPEYRGWEFQLPEEAESTETYWEIGNYPKYYHITAKTSEQFLIAKETFLKMVRDGSLGKSPEAIYEHVNNFKEVFGSEGGRQVRAGNVSREFMTEQRQELEAQLYVFGADYSNDTYNPKSYKDFMMAMALHEGPARWTRLLRTGNGQVGAFTYLFDKEAVMEIFNNPVGERGELDIIAQHYLQDQVKVMAIERGMGIALKDYDPKDPNNPVRSIHDDNAKAVRAKELKANLERIGLHIPDEEFKNLYEGFDGSSAHILNFLKYAQLDNDQIQQLPDDLQQLANQTKVHLTKDQLETLPKSLKDSIALGRIQLEINKIRLEIHKRGTVLKSGETLFNRLLDDKRISKEDRDLYMDAYRGAEANFDIAFQMQGASQEKVRRGKGFFYVDRNYHIQVYRQAEEKSARIAWILRELQKFKESNGEEGKKLEGFSKEIQDFYKGLTDQEKTKTPQGLYGINSRQLTPEIQKSIQIGWMLSEMRDGRRLDSFNQQEQAFYTGLGKEYKKDYVDHVPVYLAEKFIQTAVTLTKMKYADDEPIWNDQRFTKKLIDISLEAEIWQDPVLKKQLGEMSKNQLFKDKPLIMIPNFKAMYRSAMVKKARAMAIDGVKRHGFEARLYDVGYDVNGNEIAGSRKAMMLKRPKLKLNADGSISRDPDTGKPLLEKVDEVEVTFRVAADPDNIYSRYTTHTYWGYQGENRQMILRPGLFEAAKRIRAGSSRPEDEDVLATQLLIIDPTLKRVRKFDPEKETAAQQRETTLFQAAVEESFLSHVYVNKDLFKAFLPKDGHRGRMGAGYNMEDWGGMMRFTMGIRELCASQPARFTRRLGAEIAIMPMYTDSMAAIWGQDGVIGAVSMFADKIKDIGQQGIVSQFGITKFIDQMDYAVQLYNALIGAVQEGKHVEGLAMKPTNDNEALHRFIEDVQKIRNNPKNQMEFLPELRKTFGRLETVLKIMRPMYSDVRNAGGALRLENVDIFLDNGKFNPSIESDPTVYMNTGTSRHLESDFYDEFAEWLISEWPGGGGQIYPEELVWNQFLLLNRVVYKDAKTGAINSARGFKQWFFEKAGL